MSVFGPEFHGDTAAHEALAALTAALQARHRGSVEAVLFYGSCLRSGDPCDGLADLYVIVGSYRKAHRNLLSAVANRLLAPNVYYLQLALGERTVRCKYAVLSLPDLERAVSPHWFESYVWGRFCQPVSLIHSSRDATAQRVRTALQQAAITFLERTLPCAPPSGAIGELWQRGLALSYATELRAESSQRPATLLEHGARHFQLASVEIAALLRWDLRIENDRYQARVPTSARRHAAAAWAIRRVQGKLLSVLRLLKALFTFEGGFDYIAWKLERHSGRTVEIPPRVRRYPLIFVWGLMWKLYREGVFK